jgi:hypothetical protein
VGLLLPLMAGCTGEPPTLLDPEQPRMTGTAWQPSLLVGEWETTWLVSVPSPPDLQTWTTVWVFRPDSTCHFRRTVRSLVEGVDRVTARPCSWTAANFQVRVRWTDHTGGTAILPYEFPFLDRNRLVLEGTEFRRRR